MELLKKFKDYERDNNTAEFWEQLGLLAQLDDELKPTIVKEYDRMVRCLLVCDNYISATDVCVFPAIRKAVVSGGLIEEYSPMKLCDTIDQELKKAADIFSSEPYNDLNIDYEAEITAIVAKQFTKKTKEE